MALKKLSEKLDQISEHELGFEFDEAAVWSKLEQRLDKRNRYIYWWVAAACLLAGLIFVPIEVFKDTGQVEHAISDNTDKVLEEVIVPKQTLEVKQPQIVNQTDKEFKSLTRKGIGQIQVADVSGMKLSLKPIETPKKEENYKPAFAAEDISIIQASLGQPSIENGRTMTIRAQWQKSPDELNVNYQALKIKLYEKNK